jgi:hypothetical protein
MMHERARDEGHWPSSRMASRTSFRDMQFAPRRPTARLTENRMFDWLETQLRSRL